MTLAQALDGAAVAPLWDWTLATRRPKNETLRAQAMVGAAVQLGSLSNADTQEDSEQSNRAPRLDIGLLAHKYSQESNIKFLNALGASTVIYELEGLGSHYTRFSGDYDTRRFKGHLFGGQMGAMWQTGHRSAVSAQWTATVSLGKRQIDKSLDDAGNATIDNTESKIMQAELTYQGGLTCHYWAQLMWTRQTDALTRHVYDMGTSGYREISTQQKWEGTNNIIALRFRALHHCHRHEQTGADRRRQRAQSQHIHPTDRGLCVAQRHPTKAQSPSCHPS